MSPTNDTTCQTSRNLTHQLFRSQQLSGTYVWCSTFRDHIVTTSQEFFLQICHISPQIQVFFTKFTELYHFEPTVGEFWVNLAATLDSLKLFFNRQKHMKDREEGGGKW